METLTVTRQHKTCHEATVPESLDAFRQWQFTSGGTTGPDFKRFARLFKVHIKKSLPNNCDIVDFSTGHYYVSGFVRKGERFVFFSISDVRYFPGKWADDILIRTAEHGKDFTGGRNQSTTLERFAESVDSLLN